VSGMLTRVLYLLKTSLGDTGTVGEDIVEAGLPVPMVGDSVEIRDRWYVVTHRSWHDIGADRNNVTLHVRESDS
jgi:hypothetical protein